jgi:hypothetical protein
MRLKTLLILILSFYAIPTYAQYKAGIQGVVVDPQGSVVEGATVTLTSKETNISKTTTSDSSGIYNFLSLAPGRYAITVEKTGFKKQSLEDVVVAAEQTQAVNIALEVGDVTQSVTVTAEFAPAIDTETGQISSTLSDKEIQSLPSFGRDPFQLLRLAPGVFGDAAHNNGGGSQNTPGSAGPGGSSATSSIFATENQVQINANGQRNIANSFQIDGVEVNSLDWGGAAIVTPNEESVKEVRITSNQYSAENGRNSGAQVEVVSQNGTNEYHGSIFIKIDRPGLNAFQKVNNPNNPKSVQRVTNRFNQIGGSVGGPILKNRLFGFFSYETVRNSSVNTGTGWVETPQFLKAVGAQTGFISGGLLSFPGEGASFTTNLNATCAQVNLPATNCQAISGGLDIGSPLTSGRGAKDSTFGAAGTPYGVGSGLDGIPDVAFVQTVNPTNTVATQWNGRADFQATSKDLLAYSIYWVPNDATFLNGPARPANLWHSDRLNYSEALLWNHTFNSSMLNEARFNVSRWYFDELQSNPQEPWGLPLDFLNCAPGSSLCPSNYGTQGPGIFFKTAYNIRDTVSRVQGKHTLKFGVDIYKEQNKQTNAGGARPDYVFRSMWEFANDAPIQEFGNFDPRTGVPTSVTGYVRSNIYALFVQDDFKLKPNLTVNLGMRWEYFGPFHEKFGNLSHPILGAAPNQLAGLTLKLGGDLYSSSAHNFGPQIGFAWSPNALPLLHHEFHNRLVIRGGFGIGYNRMEDAILLGNLSNPPLVSFFNFTGSSAADILYAAPSNTKQFAGWPMNPNAELTFDPTSHLPTNGGPVTLNGVDNNLSTPYTYRYSLEAQYDLGRSWVATVGYQGSLSRHYTRQENLNWNYSPLNPRVNNLFFWTNDVNGNYNALLTEIQHHFSNSFEIDAQYTYSKSMDDGSFDYNIGDYPFDRRLEYGPSDYDVTNNFKLWGLWSPRIFRGSNGWMEKVAGGWTVSGIWVAHSGFPWTPEYNVQIINSPGGNTCSLIYPGSGFCTVRPGAYLGGAGSNYSNSTFEKSLGNFPNGPATYFTPPALTTSGIPAAPGIDRNTFRGPRYSSVDFTLAKAFGFPRLPVLGENSKLEIRANFYNLFNQVNFAALPNQTIGTIQVNALTGVQTNPTASGTTRFGQVQNGLAGRVIELQARFSF